MGELGRSYILFPGRGRKRGVGMVHWIHVSKLQVDNCGGDRSPKLSRSQQSDSVYWMPDDFREGEEHYLFCMIREIWRRRRWFRCGGIGGEMIVMR